MQNRVVSQNTSKYTKSNQQRNIRTITTLLWRVLLPLFLARLLLHCFHSLLLLLFLLLAISLAAKSSSEYYQVRGDAMEEGEVLS